ncbi:D-glucuronyl C5-epimerase family protein [Patulibacter sp.]|uniref:D-glucuronyl C5-epimerase family protein n=1 Tax=Patulibacter sp. TaxID=1912859 RepID=UPI00272320BB|nr:D-glucuronyl C5-epimerase family protein [Patulibacter sp.]MDO9410703.1 D-glucuronyl C5-epimerase family protein [Patulibacter sp.]
MSSPAPARRRTVPAVAAALVLGVAAPALLPGPGPLGAAPADAATKKPSAKKPAKKKPKKPRYTVEGELRKLQLAGDITAAQRSEWRTLYRDVVARAKAAPKGTARTELQGVAQNTETIAAERDLTASLAPSVFLTLQVNREWWATKAAPGDRSRPIVPGSPLTWQYYKGEGLQIQWLATFGLANALATTTTPAKLEQLRAIQDEALRLASDRAGGPAWQYLFDFGGGKPPWGSGMAQATAMQSLVRTTTKLGDPKYRDTALRSVGLLRRSTPTGARLKGTAGDHLLLYTFAKTRVLNAFSQTVSALHEVAAATQDGKVNALYVRAERQLRAELPSYDLGTWARYNVGGAKETPSYHLLSRDNLRGLCKVLTADAGAFAAGQPVAGAQPPAPAAPYCAMADRFTRDLTLTPSGPKTRAKLSARSAERVRGADDATRDTGAAVADPAVSQP